MRPCGKYENFIAGNKDCMTCPNNIDCVIEYAKSIGCWHIEAGERCLTKKYSCSPEMEQVCQKIANIIYFQRNICPNFSDTSKNNIASCLLCPEETFTKCETFEEVRKNLSLDPDEIGRTILREKSKLLTDNEDCFGNFDLENEQCWKDCVYKISCLRTKGIKAGKECALFPATNNLKIEQFKPECLGCMLRERCNIDYEEISERLKKEIEEKKLFRSFFSLSEMRELLTEEE